MLTYRRWKQGRPNFLQLISELGIDVSFIYLVTPYFKAIFPKCLNVILFWPLSILKIWGKTTSSHIIPSNPLPLQLSTTVLIEQALI